MRIHYPVKILILGKAMRFTVLKSIILLVFVSIFSLSASAAGLQNYLQTSNATADTTHISAQTPSSDSTTAPSITSTSNESINAGSNLANNQFMHILELVVAGIVASALILSILVLFLGRWAGNREKKAIKKLRIEIEQEQEHITAAASTIKQQEKETTLLSKHVRDEVKGLHDHKENIQKHQEEIVATSQLVQEKSKKIDQVTEKVSGRFDDIQSYWETQLNDTVTTIKELQGSLDQSHGKIDDDIEKMHNQKILSQELLQDFLDRHNEQGKIIEKNTGVSEEVSKNLDETLKESKQLVELLKQHQQNAEKSLNNFTDELSVFESQAYEQFDASFQVADLARQELTANVDESRKHIETMRRNEEKSHTINTQTQKNLESLDYSKIVKLSNTIDSAQDMFSDMRSKVEETKTMLDELKDIETDVRKTASNVEDSLENNLEKNNEENNNKAEKARETSADKDSDSLLDDEQLHKNIDENLHLDEAEYKMVSGGDNAPISFFKNIKKNRKEK